MDFSVKEIVSAFMVLFAIIDITGSIPIIIDIKSKGGQVKPLFAAIGSLVLFILFLIAGDGLLSLFGVNIESFAVAASIVICLFAINKLM